MEDYHDSNRGHTYLGNPDDMKQIYPDYVEMIRASACRSSA